MEIYTQLISNVCETCTPFSSLQVARKTSSELELDFLALKIVRKGSSRIPASKQG